MKAWFYRKTEPFLELREIQKPECLDNCVLIKVKGVSVCGTDEQLFKGQITEVQDEIIPGHEFYGEVAEIGSLANDILLKRGLEKVKQGSLVASESHYKLPGFLGEGVIGLWGPKLYNGNRIHPIDGAYAEYTLLPATCIYPISEKSGFTPSLLEPAGNDALIGLYLKENGAKNIGIIGCGSHGLYAQIFARHFGAEKVAAFEIDPYRLKFTKKLKVADQVLNSNDPNLEERVLDFTDGQGFDAMVDIAGGHQQVLDLGMKYTKDKGILVLFGLYENPKISIAGQRPNDIIFGRKKLELSLDFKKISVKGITGRSAKIWKYLIKILPKDKKLRKLLMKPVKNMGHLDRLGDAINRNPKVLKRAYKPFKS